MTTAAAIISLARVAGLKISDIRPGLWGFSHVTLHENSWGDLVISGATGEGALIRDVDDLRAFLRDSAAFWAEARRRDP